MSPVAGTWRRARRQWVLAVLVSGAIVGYGVSRAIREGGPLLGLGLDVEDASTLRVAVRLESSPACPGCEESLLPADVEALRDRGLQPGLAYHRFVVVKSRSGDVEVPAVRAAPSLLDAWRPRFFWRDSTRTAGAIVTQELARRIGLARANNAYPEHISVAGEPAPVIGVVASRAAMPVPTELWLLDERQSGLRRLARGELLWALVRGRSGPDSIDSPAGTIHLRPAAVHARYFRADERRRWLRDAAAVAWTAPLVAIVLAGWALRAHGGAARARRLLAGEGPIRAWRPFLLPGTLSFAGGAAVAAVAATIDVARAGEQTWVLPSALAIVAAALAFGSALAMGASLDQAPSAVRASRQGRVQSLLLITLLAPLCGAVASVSVAALTELSAQQRAFALVRRFEFGMIGQRVAPPAAGVPSSPLARWSTASGGLLFLDGRGSRATDVLNVAADPAWWSIAVPGGMLPASGTRLVLTEPAWRLARRPALGSAIMLAGGAPSTLVGVAEAGLPREIDWIDAARLRATHTFQAWIVRDSISLERAVAIELSRPRLSVAGPEAEGASWAPKDEWMARWNGAARRESIVLGLELGLAFAGLVTVLVRCVGLVVRRDRHALAVCWLSGATPTLLLRMIVRDMALPTATSCLAGTALVLLLARTAVSGARGAAPWQAVLVSLLIAATCATVVLWHVRHIGSGGALQWLAEERDDDLFA